MIKAYGYFRCTARTGVRVLHTELSSYTYSVFKRLCSLVRNVGSVLPCLSKFPTAWHVSFAACQLFITDRHVSFAALTIHHCLTFITFCCQLIFTAWHVSFAALTIYHCLTFIIFCCQLFSTAWHASFAACQLLIFAHYSLLPACYFSVSHTGAQQAGQKLVPELNRN